MTNAQRRTLYLLLSGRHPTGSTSSAPADVVRSVLEVEPARLGLGDLDTVIARALAKAPAERYQTAAAFADDLQRVLRHEPVSARGDSLECADARSGIHRLPNDYENGWRPRDSLSFAGRQRLWFRYR